MKNQGQSIVEYSLIAVLVVLGIMFMGPYVIRSIDAHFKLWDDGTQDSFQENLKQASLNVMPTMSSNCECTSTTEDCGGPGLLCAANQREIGWTCTPYQGCNGAAGNSTCETDTHCCGCPGDSGCGSADISNPDPVAMPCPSTSSCTNTITTIPPGTTACFCPVGSTWDAANNICTTPVNPPSSPCYYGYRNYSYLCGASTPSVCVPDPYVASTGKGCPAPTCYGSIAFPGSTLYCDGSLAAASAHLTSNVPNTYVASCDGKKACEVYCVAPYILNGTPPGANQCILHFVVAPNYCSAGPPNNTVNAEVKQCASCGSNPVKFPNPSNGNSSCNCNSCTQINVANWSCVHDYTSHSRCSTITNDESFTACSSGLPIAAVTPIPSSPVSSNSGDITLTNGDVCGSPEGMPGFGCDINVTWGNSN